MNPYAKLYDYQMEAVLKTQTADRGIICLPTGMGKTMIQSAMVAKAIQDKPGFAVYVVNAPRIVLSLQLFREISSMLVENRLDCRFVTLHSGRANQEEMNDLHYLRSQHRVEYSDVTSTTTISIISEELSKAKETNQPVVIFATYHSTSKLSRLDTQVDMVLNDEAHYLVQDRFHESITEIGAKRNYFFTATMRFSESSNGFGMNNESVYGSVLYVKTPREAIEMGKMVRPRLHIVSHHDGRLFSDSDVDRQIGKVVSTCFDQHQYQLKTRVNAKLLIAAEGTDDIYNFLNSAEYSELVESGIKVYALASDPRVGNRINDERVDRSTFLKRLKKDGEDRSVRLVVMHFDILSEGIDVPGLTGALILRNMNKAKFIQTIGRALRLNTQDRAKIDTKKISPSDVKSMLKPYGYVIIPSLKAEDADTIARLTGYVMELRDYGFDPVDDLIVSSAGTAIPTREGAEAFQELISSRTPMGDAMEALVASIEDERIANLSVLDFLAA